MDKQEITTWWIDTTTLHIAFEQPGRRPTGIPRVAAEIVKAAKASAPEGVEIQFVRYDASLPGLKEVSSDDISELIVRSAASVCAISLRLTVKPFALKLARKVVALLPAQWGRIIVKLRHQLPTLMPLLARRLKVIFVKDDNSELSLLATANGYSHPFRDGDVWVNVGCWYHGDLPKAITQIRHSGLNIKSYVLIHDCMPLIFPEFFPRELVYEWRSALHDLVAGTQTYLCCSENTGRDIAEVLLNYRDATKNVRRIHLGDAFFEPLASDHTQEAILTRLGLNEPYVLVVGTIEVRKNHSLVFRAWRTLLRRHRSAIPKLVFVGKWGWKTNDLKEQLRDSGGLEGSVVVLEDISDEELDALYRAALFTIYPSLYEGWGLPLRESHAYGKVCIAARNSSMLEAGEDLAIYFTNDCQESLIEAVESLLADPLARQAREKRIKAEFHPISWADAWRDLVLQIQHNENRS